MQNRAETQAPGADYPAIADGLLSSNRAVAEKALTDLISYLHRPLAAWLKQHGVIDDNIRNDILQITWQKVWFSRAAIDPARLRPAWVFRICINALIDFIRDRKKRREVALTDSRSDSLTADVFDEQEPCASQQNKRRVLQTAVIEEIRTWPEVDQRIIWAWVNSDSDEWTKQLSQETSKKPATLRKRLFDLKERLRKVAAALNGHDGLLPITLSFNPLLPFDRAAFSPDDTEGRPDNRA